MAGLVLVIGFFFACGPSKPDVDTLINTGEYDAALTRIQEQLNEQPGQPGLLQQRGEIYGLKAMSLPPAERTSSYTEMVRSFEESNGYGADSSMVAEMNSTQNRYWTQEHNAGTAAYAGDESEQDLALAEAHFQNATNLRPGEVNSYISLATTQYAAGQLDKAIETLNTAKNMISEVPPRLYENLGFLYLQEGNAEQSVFYYELASKNIIQSKNIAFGLVNTYISTGNTESAIELLRPLSEAYPEDAEIHNVYGTQLYLLTEQIISDLQDAYINKDTLLADQIRFEAEGIGEQAEEQLLQAYSRDTTQTEYLQSLAIFYNNMTGNYLALAEIAFDDQAESMEVKAATLLNLALEYYTKLDNLVPNDPRIINTIRSLEQLKEARFTD